MCDGGACCSELQVTATVGVVKAASCAQPLVGPDLSHSGVVHNLPTRKKSRLAPITQLLVVKQAVALQQVPG